jgi:hypothetical protein
MAFLVEDLNDQNKFRLIHSISYKELIPFIIDYLQEKTILTFFFWSSCLILLINVITIRINIAGAFPSLNILFHSSLGLIFIPILSIPVHELLHIIPYYICGARKIRVGIDLKQYLFYVTAHRHITTPLQFRIVAVTPFLLISIITLFLVLLLPGLWKWSLSLFWFVHTTMCAGDLALLNFYYLNRDKKIYTWDDADQKTAYFYEELSV